MLSIITAIANLWDQHTPDDQMVSFNSNCYIHHQNFLTFGWSSVQSSSIHIVLYIVKALKKLLFIQNRNACFLIIDVMRQIIREGEQLYLTCTVYPMKVFPIQWSIFIVILHVSYENIKRIIAIMGSKFAEFSFCHSACTGLVEFYDVAICACNIHKSRECINNELSKYLIHFIHSIIQYIK